MRHNLFGAPTEAHVVVNDDEDFKVQQIIPGDTVDDVLKSVHYDPNELVEGPSKRRQNPQNDASDALKALLTQQRSLPTYLDSK
jgi:arginine decarboxylase